MKGIKIWQNSRSVISTEAAERHEYLTYANNSTLDLKASQQPTTLEFEPSPDVKVSVGYGAHKGSTAAYISEGRMGNISGDVK